MGRRVELSPWDHRWYEAAEPQPIEPIVGGRRHLGKTSNVGPCGDQKLLHARSQGDRLVRIECCDQRPMRE